MLRGILVKLLDFPWNDKIIFVLRIWWTASTCLWTMWGVVHGGPATMAGTEPHHSLAMGRSEGTCRDRGESKRTMSLFHLASYQQRECNREVARQRSLTAVIGVRWSTE
jgi:hypothetical protein